MRLHGRPAGGRATGWTTAPTPSWPPCSPPWPSERAARRAAHADGRRSPCSTGTCCRHRRTDAHLRPAHPHDLAHHRRLPSGWPPPACGPWSSRRSGSGQPRTNPGSFADYFDSLLGWEPFRAAQFGIRHHATHRAQPQGGQRPALPGRARPAAALPGQGRRGRGRRDRLRLDDPGRGRGVRRPARPGRRARAAGAGAHPAPGQGAPAPGAPWTSSPSPASTRAGSPSTTSTRSPSALVRDSGCWMGFSIYPDTKMSPPRMVEILQGVRHRADPGQLGRRLGPLRPAADRGDRRGDAGGRVHRRRRRPGAVAQPGRVLRPVRAARPRPREPDGRRVRGQLHRCGAAADAAAAPRRQARAPVATAPTCTPPRTSPGILAQLDTYAVPIRERLGADVLGLGLWLAAPVAAGLAADAADRQRLRRELDARGLEVVTLNGFPYQAFQAPVVKHAVYQPDWTTPQRLAYTLDLARVLADLLPDDAARGSISTLPLAWRDAVGRRPGGRLPPRTSTSWPGRWHELRPATIRVGLRARARLRRRDHRPGRRAARRGGHRPARRLPRPRPPRLRLGGAGRGPGRPGAAPACRSSRSRCRPPWPAPTRAADAAGARRVRRAALPAPDPRPARAVHRRPRPGAGRGPAARQPWRVHYHVPLHAAARPPLRHHRRRARRRRCGCSLGGPSALLRPPRRRDVHLDVLPPASRPDGPRRAGRRHRRRARLRPRPADRAGPAPPSRE